MSWHSFTAFGHEVEVEADATIECGDLVVTISAVILDGADIRSTALGAAIAKLAENDDDIAEETMEAAGIEVRGVGPDARVVSIYRDPDRAYDDWKDRQIDLEDAIADARVTGDYA